MCRPHDGPTQPRRAVFRRRSGTALTRTHDRATRLRRHVTDLRSVRSRNPRLPGRASADLGSHHGLPVTVIVTTTLKELEDGAGIAITGSGTRLPMRDLIRMAAHAHHYLAIFNDNGRPLYLGRSKRIASPDQRLVLHARDRGCTHPGCHVPGYLRQVHHITDWAHDGTHRHRQPHLRLRPPPPPPRCSSRVGCERVGARLVSFRRCRCGV
ncbi:HNH endonuclease, partial [Mycobacteroides abscessus]